MQYIGEVAWYLAFLAVGLVLYFVGSHEETITETEILKGGRPVRYDD